MKHLKRRRCVVAYLSLLSVTTASASPASGVGGHAPRSSMQLGGPPSDWFAPPDGRRVGSERASTLSHWNSQRRRSAVLDRGDQEDVRLSPHLFKPVSSTQQRIFARFPPRGGAEADDGDDAVSGRTGSKNVGGSSDDDDDNKDPPLLSAATVLETTTTTVLEPIEDHLVTTISTASSTDPVADDTEMNPARTSNETLSPTRDEAGEEKTVGVDTDGLLGAEEELSGIAYDPEESSRLRARGKELHDAGQYVEAAELFRQASIRLLGVGGNDGGDDNIREGEVASSQEEYATCRLHEALCRLKAGGTDQANLAVAACASVLDRRDGLPNVLVARAYHRRAKAHVALDHPDEALRDARSAAFLGDRKAVALYGTLLREHPGEAGALAGGDGPSWAGPSGSSDSASLLDLLMNAGGGSGNQATSAAPSPMDAFAQGGFPLFPSLSGMGGDGGGSGSLAKSVLSSLSKKIRDESTQESICNFLQQASPSQLQSFAGMAGLPLAERHADQLARFCNGITPTTLQRWIRLGQRVSYVVRLIQKVLKLMSKYRAIILLLCLLAWAKSAILRPLPVSRAARKAALRAAAATATSAIPTV